MVQYADDSIRINEEEMGAAFRALPEKMQKGAETAFTIMSMNLFYPENAGKKSNPRADESGTDPDAYMKSEG